MKEIFGRSWVVALAVRVVSVAVGTNCWVGNGLAPGAGKIGVGGCGGVVAVGKLGLTELDLSLILT